MSPYSEDRLPGHERRKRELLAMLDTREPSRSRALMPGIAAGAVLAVCTVAILAAQPWRDPRNLSPAGPVAGQDPTQGVPEDAAKPGDPVPWDVANRTLAACLKQGPAAVYPSSTFESAPRASGLSPSEAASGWPASSPPGSGSSGTLPPASMGATLPSGTPPEIGDMPPRTPGGGADATGLPRRSTRSTSMWWPTGGSTVAGTPGSDGRPVAPTSTPRPSGASTAPDGSAWKVREPDAAFKPYFTAWEKDGTGVLRPFVLGKAGKPDLLVCHGEQSSPELPAPTAADGTLAGAFEVRRSQVLMPPTPEPLRMAMMSSTTWWGRTTGAVARVVVELPDGSTRGAVVRNGVWLANVPGEDIVPVRIRAYDAAGTLLHERAADPESLRCADAPTTEACGRRTHWG
ncbi:hypothetical protein ACFZBU_26475 [Embleya sp. NPDC008237]|uniref:hypothetical protein n=1 Tax=Embleya sp. NPDC008237 TaxID=3363978 RepID=UPI0036EA1A22